MRCPVQRGRKTLACRFLQHLEVLSSCNGDTIAQLCPKLPSHLLAESIFSHIQDQCSLQLLLIWMCPECAISSQPRASTPGSSPAGAHKAYLILPCRSILFPLLPSPTGCTPFSTSPTPFSSSFSWKSRGTWETEKSQPARGKS